MQNMQFIWETPKPYGWFHISFIIVMILVSVFSCIIACRKKTNHLQQIIFLFGLFLLAIELYKQIYLTIPSGEYQWYAFPFQLCSMPIYIALIVPLIRHPKVQLSLYAFLALYGTLAGISVMIYPGDVLTSDISISIHSMLWHVTMVVMGLYVLVAKHQTMNKTALLGGTLVFWLLVMFAQMINLIGYLGYFKYTTTTWNLFYISPFYPCRITPFNSIQYPYGWILFFIGYISVIPLGAYIIWFINQGRLKKCK